MRVSTKIVSGIGILFLLGLLVLVNQLFVVRQLERMTRELAEIDIKSATTALELTRLADAINVDTRKYFGSRDPIYESQITSLRDDFIQGLTRLQNTSWSDRERREGAKLRKALDDYWTVFNRIKRQDQSFSVDSLPPDLSVTVNHLQAQTEVTLDAIQVTVRERIADAAKVRQDSVRMSLIIGVLFLVLTGIMAVLIVRAIGDPINRLTQGIRAISMGQFWHRVPSFGSDEFSELARDFNRMSDTLHGLGHVKKDFESLLRECPVCGLCDGGDSKTCREDTTELKLIASVERTIHGRYRLDHLIGRGGMGAVYRAQDLSLNRTVAVKVMTEAPIRHTAALKRFEREARAAAALAHPNIISVHDYGRMSSNGANLVMEFSNGRTWRSELQRLGSLSPSAMSGWIDQVLDGLAAAHEQGVIHRDLKPENLLLTGADSEPVVKILDFGLAKVVADETTMTMTLPGEILGTYGYMSPEQLSGRPVDERTDLFAVGVIVFEMLTGYRPFRGASLPDLVRSVFEDDVHLPGEGELVRRLESIVQWCVAKDPAKRVRSAEALRQELVPALRDCPKIVAAAAASARSATTLPG